MSTELINRITVKKDGVYISSHSSNDTAPFHSWRCKGLSEIYAAEGQKGLDREIVCMLYEYAQLRGSHKSLDRYRYAIDSLQAQKIYKKYSDMIDERYESLDEADKKTVWYKLTEKAKEYRAYVLRDCREVRGIRQETKKPRFRTIRRCTKIWLRSIS